MTGKTHVLVIGGGYAGVMAANRVLRRSDVTVSLINPRPAFVERIRLHQLVGGSDDAVQDFADLLADGVRLIVDTVERIDATDRSVTLATGESLSYDYLIYAVGSATEPRGVPGAAEFAYPIATLEAARRLRGVLGAGSAGGATVRGVTVVGGGLTGIETAAELAELGHAVTLVAGRVLGPSLHPRARRSVARRLTKLGVTLLDGEGATVTAVERDAVRLSDGRRLASGVTIWTVGFGVPELAARSGLTTDAVGRLLTDETLTSVDDVRIVAAGDSASPSGVPFRMSCQAAVQLGPQAAETVLSRIAGERPAPLRLGFVSQCVSLGRRAGVLQLTGKDDTAKRMFVGGRVGARLKEFICWGTVKQLDWEASKPGLLRFPSWAMDDTRARLLHAGSDQTVGSQGRP
jgi:NADH dehydrogenase FAD-containing subunit